MIFNSIPQTLQEFSTDCRALISAFLVKVTSNFFAMTLFQDPKDRLGTEDGAVSVKLHPYFANTDWDLLEQVGISSAAKLCFAFKPVFCHLQGKVKPPFVPKLKSDGDTSCFDAEFTDLKPEITKIKLSGEETSQCRDNFPGFSFTAFRF